MQYFISVFVVGEKRQSVMKEDVHIWPYVCISINLVITSDSITFQKPGGGCRNNFVDHDLLCCFAPMSFSHENFSVAH